MGVKVTWSHTFGNIVHLSKVFFVLFCHTLPYEVCQIELGEANLLTSHSSLEYRVSWSL